MQIEQDDDTHCVIVRPANPGGLNGVVTFLHVFYVSPADRSHISVDLRLIDESEQLGVTLGDRAGTTWVVRVLRDGVGLADVQRGAPL